MKTGDIFLITVFLVIFVLLVSLLGTRTAPVEMAPDEAAKAVTNVEPESPGESVALPESGGEQAALGAVVASRAERGYPWDLIVIHHSGAERGDAGAIERAPHVPHFVIGNGQGMTLGEVAATGLWRQQIPGTHAGDAAIDARAIGITLIGRYDRSDPPTLQLQAAADLVEILVTILDLERSQIFGHSELPGAATACPGRIPVQMVAGTAR